MLEALGLDAESTSMYRLMLTRPTWDVDQLTAASELPHEAVKPCLDRLTELALLRESARDPGLFRPVRPEVGLRRLARQQEEELLARRQAVADSYLSMSRMIADFACERPGAARPEVEVLEDADEARARIEALAFQTSACSEAFVPGGAQPPEAVAAARTQVSDALARGIRVRRIYLESAANDALTRDHLRWLSDRGCELRMVPALPLSLTLVDRQVAVLPLSVTDGTGAMILSGSGVLAVLAAYFDQTWTTARSPGTRAQRIDGASPQERELLRVLAAGRTDEAAARHLGLSLRTIRRMVADLMDRLGAHSRFEAGVRATQHGWLNDSTTPPPDPWQDNLLEPAGPATPSARMS